MTKTIQNLILFIIGGISYNIIEILWRGYSHISMFILGGLCFITIGFIREYFFLYEKSIFTQLIISCIIITVLELIFGLFLNVELRLNVWDYSNLPFNFMGQISLVYTIFWFILSFPLIFVYDYLKYSLFGEERPRYRIIN